MHLGYLQFQDKCLYGGVVFIIKILIKSLSNVLRRMKLLIKYELLQSWCHGFLLLLKFEMNVSS